MSEHDDDDGHKQNGAEPEFSIGQSKAVIPMLVAAGLAILVITLNITGTTAPLAPVGTPADKAYSPKDFPAIYGQDIPRPVAGPADGKQGLYPVPAPPFSDEKNFPCTSCHDDTMPPDPERRELTMHDEIVLHHDEEHRWCLDCHDANNRDVLHLASGAPVKFTESYQLCGQCHGTQYRDWRVGIHGKRIGDWSGTKQYLLCVHCHNPHSPRFQAIEPMPPPIRPQYLLAQVEHPAPRHAAPVASTEKETVDGREAH